VSEITLPHEWEPRSYQQALWRYMHSDRRGKRAIAIWPRRHGKDDVALHYTACAAMERVGVYWHLLPQQNQARKAIWNAVNPHTGKRRIDEAFPQEIRSNTNEHEMFIRFKNEATWQVVGSDNFNSLVGTPPVGITASEWALANPTAWAYLSPIIAENGGWASFISTPRGNNHLKGMLDQFKDDPAWFTEVLTAEYTGAISAEIIESQRREYESLFGAEVAEMLVQQEFFCSFAGAMVGAYWGAEIFAAENDGRIADVPIDWKLPVHTAWDLGKPTNNPIWCFQVVGSRLNVVDFYRPDSEDLADWCAWLDKKGYHGTDYVPHDIFHTNWGSKRSRIEMLLDQKRKPFPVKKASLADGISAGRETIKVAHFDADRCRLGIDGLKNYRREWDDEMKVFRNNPVKDWAEHIGSAFRYLGLAWRELRQAAPPPPPPKQIVVGGQSTVTLDDMWKHAPGAGGRI